MKSWQGVVRTILFFKADMDNPESLIFREAMDFLNLGIENFDFCKDDRE